MNAIILKGAALRQPLLPQSGPRAKTIAHPCLRINKCTFLSRTFHTELANDIISECPSRADMCKSGHGEISICVALKFEQTLWKVFIIKTNHFNTMNCQLSGANGDKMHE
jgi:hypothetical protein